MSCRKMRGLIAASVYGDLTHDEQLTLDGHLASCPACRNEAAAFVRMASAIPVKAVELDHDLVSAVRRRLYESESSSSVRVAWRFAAPLGAAAALFVIISYVAMTHFPPQSDQWRQADASGDKGLQPLVQPLAQPLVQPVVLQADDVSPVQCALTEADRLARYHDYTNAYRALKQSVEESPDDPLAGDAQLRRADIAFSLLRWYPEACEDYELLADRYPAVFVNSVESIRRRDLLAEARERDYASLHALDAALRSNDNQFAQLERVIARYPGTFVASSAAEDMARLTAVEDAAAGEASARLAAMERARDRCTNVIAKRQLNLEVGHIYQREMNDPAKAVECYNEVIENDNAVLAQLAKQSLAELGPLSR